MSSTQVVTPTTPQPRLVTLSFTSDMNCPWCYIGAKELNKAIDRVNAAGTTDSKLEFKLEYQPFILDPTLSLDQPTPKVGRLEKKLGEERVVKIKKMLDERGKNLGINFQWGGSVRQTTNSHRLLLRTLNEHGSEAQQRLLYALWVANFENEQDIGNPELLAQFVEDLGFGNKDQTLAFLASDELSDQVNNLIKEAQRMGISGVPFTVIDGKWAVSGGQSADVFYQIFEKLARGENP